MTTGRAPLHLHPANDRHSGDGFVLVLPGGGYWARAAHEAGAVTDFLAEHGIASGHLEYAVAPARYPEALLQVLLAIADLRAGVHGPIQGPIGVIGFSAGGHLAGSAATATDEELRLAAEAGGIPLDALGRPDAVALGYPVVSMTEHPHIGSRVNLLGEVKAVEAVRFGVDRRLDASTPPLFVFHTVADPGVPVEHALLLVAAAHREGVPVEAHLYAEGEHGVGLALERPEPMSRWTDQWLDWLARAGISPTAGPHGRME